MLNIIFPLIVFAVIGVFAFLTKRKYELNPDDSEYCNKCGAKLMINEITNRPLNCVACGHNNTEDYSTG